LQKQKIDALECKFTEKSSFSKVFYIFLGAQPRKLLKMKRLRAFRGHIPRACKNPQNFDCGANKFRLRSGYRRTAVQIYFDCGAFFDVFLRSYICLIEKNFFAPVGAGFHACPKKT
jgi:hypothetical protein